MGREERAVRQGRQGEVVCRLGEAGIFSTASRGGLVKLLLGGLFRAKRHCRSCSLAKFDIDFSLSIIAATEPTVQTTVPSSCSPPSSCFYQVKVTVFCMVPAVPTLLGSRVPETIFKIQASPDCLVRTSLMSWLKLPLPQSMHVRRILMPDRLPGRDSNYPGHRSGQNAMFRPCLPADRGIPRRMLRTVGGLFTSHTAR